MNRTVVSTADVAVARATLGPGDQSNVPAADDFSSRLVKYIPPDVIGAYTAIQGVISSTAAQGAAQQRIVAWIVFAVILVATPFYLRRIGQVLKWKQIGISTFAFAVWALAYPGLPFSEFVNPAWGSVALLLVTFLIPIIQV